MHFKNGMFNALGDVVDRVDDQLVKAFRLQVLDSQVAVFNDVVKGGIKMSDPRARSRWRNVSLGDNNFGSLDELYGKSGG